MDPPRVVVLRALDLEIPACAGDGDFFVTISDLCPLWGRDGFQGAIECAGVRVKELTAVYGDADFVFLCIFAVVLKGPAWRIRSPCAVGMRNRFEERNVPDAVEIGRQASIASGH